MGTERVGCHQLIGNNLSRFRLDATFHIDGRKLVPLRGRAARNVRPFP